MRANPDPKPGRWVLPLVILGMVGMTYLIVNSLEPATPREAEGVTTTTTPEAEPETTTTTLDPIMASYLESLDRFETQAREMEEEAVGINQRWDDDEQDFQTTLDQFRELRDRVEAFADSVATQTPPSGFEDLAAAHAEMIAVSDRMLAAMEAMVEGFQGPTAEPRRQALEDFRQAVDDFVATLAEARALAGGEEPPQTDDA